MENRVQLHLLWWFQGHHDVSRNSNVGDLYAGTSQGLNLNAVEAWNRRDQFVGAGEHAAKFKFAVRAVRRLILIVHGGGVEKSAAALRHQEEVCLLCERSHESSGDRPTRACPHVDIDTDHLAAFGN